MSQLHSIQETARAAGTTSRTLRHYESLGLLMPGHRAANGYRYYTQDNLIRLQRILLLRDLGLGLDVIGQVLARETDELTALAAHLDLLALEQERLQRQSAAVEHTINILKSGGTMNAEKAFAGFDNSQYKEEVQTRWGPQAYEESTSWWNGLRQSDQRDWKRNHQVLAAAWTAAAGQGLDPAAPEVQALAQRHHDWLAAIPGTPGYPHGPSDEYLLGLGAMYVADARFAANYGGEPGAAFVRDALQAFVESRQK